MIICAVIHSFAYDKSGCLGSKSCSASTPGTEVLPHNAHLAMVFSGVHEV